MNQQLASFIEKTSKNENNMHPATVGLLVTTASSFGIPVDQEIRHIVAFCDGMGETEAMDHILQTNLVHKDGWMIDKGLAKDYINQRSLTLAREADTEGFETFHKELASQFENIEFDEKYKSFSFTNKRK